jgi:hypothetical protein
LGDPIIEFFEDQRVRVRALVVLLESIKHNWREYQEQNQT